MKAEREVFVQQIWDWSFSDESAAILNHNLSLLVHQAGNGLRLQHYPAVYRCQNAISLSKKINTMSFREGIFVALPLVTFGLNFPCSCEGQRKDKGRSHWGLQVWGLLMPLFRCSATLKLHNQVFSSPDFISRAISSAFITSVDLWVWFRALRWIEGSHKGCQWLTLGSWQCPNQGQSYPCKLSEGSQHKIIHFCWCAEFLTGRAVFPGNKLKHTHTLSLEIWPGYTAQDFISHPQASLHTLTLLRGCFCAGGFPHWAVKCSSVLPGKSPQIQGVPRPSCEHLLFWKIMTD